MEPISTAETNSKHENKSKWTRVFKMAPRTWEWIDWEYSWYCCRWCRWYPEPCVCNDSLICDIFDNCTAEEMKSRVILSPKNADCSEMNEKILNLLPTETKTYLSTDSLTSDNGEEAQNYPMEFINSFTPSGIPPHRLNLKVGGHYNATAESFNNRRLVQWHPIGSSADPRE